MQFTSNHIRALIEVFLTLFLTRLTRYWSFRRLCVTKNVQRYFSYSNKLLLLSKQETNFLLKLVTVQVEYGTA